MSCATSCTPAAMATVSRGRMHFQKIPLGIRRQMEGVDYRPAEQRCPQKMAIGSLMREALKELGKGLKDGTCKKREVKKSDLHGPDRMN